MSAAREKFEQQVKAIEEEKNHRVPAVAVEAEKPREEKPKKPKKS